MPNMSLYLDMSKRKSKLSLDILCVPILLSMAPMHLLGHNDQNEEKPDSLYIWCHWYQCWHHMVQMELKMTSLYSLLQDNWNDVQLCSCYTIGTGVTVTWCWWHHQWHHSIPEIKMIEMRCSMTFWWCAVIGIDICSMWCWCHCQWHYYIC